MKKSRISRSIIQISYMIIIVALIALEYMSGNDFSSDLWWFVSYVAIIIIAMFVYTLFRRRCRIKILNKYVRRIYKYAYIGAMVALEAIILGVIFKGKIAYATNGVYVKLVKSIVSLGANEGLLVVFLNFIFVYVNAIFIKKIIYNISNNDKLSIFVSIGYVFLPWNMCNIVLCNDFIITLTIVFGIINYLFSLLDSYIGIVYVAEDVTILRLEVLALLILVSILLGVSLVIWLIGIVLFYIITCDTNITRIKIKNVKIPKTILVFLIGICSSLIGMFIVNVCDFSIAQELDLISSFNEQSSNTAFSLLVITIFTGVFQAIALLLKRYIDGKTLFLKVFSIVLFFNLIISGSYELFMVFMYIGLVANLISIYYNRDEKIKLLNENN